MPTSQYATRSDSVLAWKKANKLGRFDPHAAEVEAAKKEVAEREIRERGQLLSPFRSNYHSHSVSLPLHPRVSACFVVYRTSYLNQPFLLLPSHLSHLRNSKQSQLQMYTGDQNPLLTTTTNQASPSTNAASSSHPHPPPPYPPPTPPKGTHPAAAQSSTLGPSHPGPNPHNRRPPPPPTPTPTPLPKQHHPKSPGSASPSTSPRAATTAR